MQPGIYSDLKEKDYHASDGISKSGLWTIYNRTPFHYRYGEKEESNAMKFGNAVHTAILEPLTFESRFVKGPEDRRGNKWKDAVEAAGDKECLTSSDYEDALRIRDALSKNLTIQKITSQKNLVENSAFYTDNVTGELCRLRPDLVCPPLKLMLDLKSTTDASPFVWKKRVADFGNHLQESMYTYGWKEAGGCPIDAFIFLTVEQDPPFAHAIYELEPSAANEGWLIYEKAMQIYTECKRTDTWPSYPEGVTPLDLPKFAYKLSKEFLS